LFLGAKNDIFNKYTDLQLNNEPLCISQHIFNISNGVLTGQINSNYINTDNIKKIYLIDHILHNDIYEFNVDNDNKLITIKHNIHDLSNTDTINHSICMNDSVTNKQYKLYIENGQLI
jgi:hypothetical protein